MRVAESSRVIQEEKERLRLREEYHERQLLASLAKRLLCGVYPKHASSLGVLLVALACA